jgi:hypothetical protein
MGRRVLMKGEKRKKTRTRKKKRKDEQTDSEVRHP